jgi:DNA-binding winged helix-turn-helix (wHTH) protein/Tol biopolymer transport system component
MTGRSDVLEFGEFRLDLRRMGVWKEDQPVPIEPKALDVLRHLIANRDRLVTKDELMDHVWKDTFVTPNALTRAVAQLRKQLGDEVDHPRLIETVAKRGYRFVAPVRVCSNGHASAVDAAAPPEPLHAPAIIPIAAGKPQPRAGLGTTTWAAAIGAAALLVIAATVILTRATRAAVARPVDVTPLTSYGDVIDAVVAPDGKSIAFVRSAQGRQSLWIRQLRGSNAIELVPAAAVSYYGVAFTPDSGSIYYVVRGPEPLAFPTGMLFQIPALGGAARRLGTPFDHHPSVSPDGRKLASLRAAYPTATESALLVTNAEGRDARTLLVAREPESVAPGFFIAPAWSPKGDRIAAAIRNGYSARLATVDVATGAVHRFDATFSSASFATWLQDGSGIAFIAANKSDPTIEFGSRIWMQPLPSGAPYPLTSGLVEYRNVSATSDASALVSVGSLQNGSMWTVPLAETDRAVKLPTLKDDGAGGVAWIDTRTIAFTSVDGGGPQVWTMAIDGSARRQLTTDGWNVWPRPARDGQTIYFVSTRGGDVALWRMNRDGTAQTRLTAAPEAHDLALSSDERSLLFTAPSSDRTESTWTASASGGEPVLLIKGLTRPAASPDGRFVAGIWQPRADTNPALAVFPSSGGDTPVKTFDRSAASANGGVWWSRESDALFFTTADRTNLWRQPIRGGAAVPATRFADAQINRGDMAPDGRSFLLFRGNPIRDAFLITGFH